MLGRATAWNEEGVVVLLTDVIECRVHGEVVATLFAVGVIAFGPVYTAR